MRRNKRRSHVRPATGARPATRSAGSHRGRPYAAVVAVFPLWLRTAKITVVVLLCACLSPAALAGDRHRGVEHIVIVWLKEPGNREARKQVLTESRKLSAIPGVLAIRTGSVVPSPRPVVDSSFDIALIISFADVTAMQNYLSHPLHLQLVENTLKPLVARIQVYDFIAESSLESSPGDAPEATDETPQAAPD